MEPKYCPYCGGTDLAVMLVGWSAKSLEETDPDNHAELWESQCQECGYSFWT